MAAQLGFYGLCLESVRRNMAIAVGAGAGVGVGRDVRTIGHRHTDGLHIVIRAASPMVGIGRQRDYAGGIMAGWGSDTSHFP